MTDQNEQKYQAIKLRYLAYNGVSSRGTRQVARATQARGRQSPGGQGEREIPSLHSKNIRLMAPSWRWKHLLFSEKCPRTGIIKGLKQITKYKFKRGTFN